MADNLTFKTTMEFAYGVPSPMSPGVVRLVARNPGPFTFKGTNTYLVGTTSLAVIDPGPDDAEHRELILKTAAGRPITHILITHTHRDHTDGLAALQSATGALSCGYGRGAAPAGISEKGPSGSEYIHYDFAPDVRMSDGDSLSGSDWQLTALHTPGHAPDHLCFALSGRHILFSGDHVMAWNTSVVAPPEGRMADYIRSLELLAGRKDRVYMPGHGGRLEDPTRTIKAYLLHRRWREQAVMGAIKDGAATIRQIVPVVYRGIDDSLVAAATLSVQAHVEHLVERGLLVCDGPPTWDQRLSPA